MLKIDPLAKLLISVLTPVATSLIEAGVKKVQKERQLRKDNIYVLPKKAYGKIHA